MKDKKTYFVNEVFLSLQGEGARTGTANLFLRFAGCNLRCDVGSGPRSPGGFACDTEFVSGVQMTADEIMVALLTAGQGCKNVICTGGEPALQLDWPLRERLGAEGYWVGIETNGTVDVSHLSLEWITVSPKVAEHAIKQRTADEVKYVRGFGQGIPYTVVKPRPYSNRMFKFISPAFCGDQIDITALRWCEKLVKEHNEWRLSVQLHKLLSMR